MFLRWWGENLVTWSIDLFRASFNNLLQPDLTPALVVQATMAFSLFSATVLGPVFGVMVLSGVISNVAQVGFLITMKPLMPDINRINPLQGFQRLFSPRSFIELAKSIAKLLIVGFVVWRSISDRLIELLVLPQMQLIPATGVALSMIFDMATWAAAALFVLAAADYGYQRFSFERQIRMSREEIREEMKQTEGNPVIRQRVRQLQRQTAQRRMMQAVPQADVVITNPTHIAVAIKYEGGSMRAPRVLAKGEGFIAEQIKRIARENDVPTMENKPLARALYKACEVGHEIPGDMYAAVAELLAFVYRLRDGRPLVRPEPVGV